MRTSTPLRQRQVLEVRGRSVRRQERLRGQLGREEELPHDAGLESQASRRKVGKRGQDRGTFTP